MDCYRSLYSKHGPWSSSLSIIWDLVRDAESQPQLRPTGSESAFELDHQVACMNIPLEKHYCLQYISQGPSKKQMSTTGRAKEL